MKFEGELTSPQQYIDSLPEERREVFGKLRQVILENLPEGFSETISYGMIGYVVPHAIYPGGYHCNPELPLPFINIGSQKNYIALYHNGIYAEPDLLDWFVSEYPKHCKLKLDMGKSCIRFKNMSDIPYGLIAELVKRMKVKEFVALYEENRKNSG